MKTMRNILLIDFSREETRLISGLLSEEGFPAVVLRPDEEAPPGEIFGYLKIFIIPGSEKSEDSLFEKINTLNHQISGPSVMISRSSNIEIYRSAFDAGISYFIITPASKDHFLRQIKTLAEIHEEEADLMHIDNPLDPLLFSLENLFHCRTLAETEIKKHYGDSLILIHDSSPGEAVSDLKDTAALKEKLQNALDRREFILYFQPVIDLENNKLAGFESLIRWNHPEKGIVPPDEFIPASEETGMIIPMGDWIIDEALLVLKKWQETFDINSLFKVGINLSAKQFLLENFSESIIKKIEEAKIPPQNIALEITESAFMEDMEKANLALLTFKSKGIPLYLDDFGTGYSSLTYLLHFPVDTLKIDKSFVEWMHIDDQSREIVKSVAALALNLNMKTVAEGIETIEHAEMARSFGCNLGQGYFFSKPLPLEKATELIAEYFDRIK